MKPAGFIVMKGGKPCALLNVSGLNRGGVLLPGAPVVCFLKRRDVRRAINRSSRIAETITGSLIETWARERAPEIFEKTAYEILPLAKQ